MIHMNKLVENEMMIYICFPIGLIAVMMAQIVLALSDHSLHCKSFLFLSEICCICPFFPFRDLSFIARKMRDNYYEKCLFLFFFT
jgi:hypothetical protein